MAIPVGGTRARLVRDNLQSYVIDGLTALGWFDPARRHAPLQVITAPDEAASDTGALTPVPLNAIAVSLPDVADDEMELGSRLTEDRWTGLVDFYAENDTVGVDVAHTVRDLLRGKYVTIGPPWDRGVCPLTDLSVQPPVDFGYLEIENVAVDRATGFNQPWRRFWWSVSFDVLDRYTDQTDVP